MFSGGGDVNISPEMDTYLKEIGVDPSGKSSQEIRQEVEETIKRQNTDVGSLIFDYKDPLDYLSTGLMFTGIGGVLGGTIKTISKTAKIKKIALALKKARERSTKMFRDYPITSTATVGSVVVPIIDSVTDTESSPPPLLEIPVDIDKELDKVNKEEEKKQKAKSEADNKAQKEKNKKLRLDKEIIDVENIISYVQDQDKAVSEQYQRDKQEKNNRNRNIFMEQMSAALAGTDNLGDGIAIGAANAAKAVGDIEESERLAYQEFLEKEESKNTLKEDTTIKVIEKYSEQVSDLDGSLYVVSKIDELQNLYSTSGITGAEGWLRSLGKDFQGFFNADGQLSERGKAENIVELLKARMVTQLLGEKGKTISDADRKLVENLIGNIKSPVSNVSSLIDLLNNVKETLNNSIRKQSGLIQAFEARYGARIPELEIIKGQTGVDISGAGSASDEAEVQINQDDVIQ